MSRTLLLLVLASTAWAICPNGTFYEGYFNKCYKVNTQSLGFLAAEQSCNKLGGNLVAIQSALESAYVSGIATASTTATSFWIGANYLMGPQWSWTTGAPVNFTLWAPSQPSDPSANQCAAVRDQDNAWTKEQCYSLKPSVCQIDPNTSPSPSPVLTCDETCPVNAVCGPGYTFYIGTCKCYKVFGSWVSIWDAQAICAQEAGILPKIPDNSTNEFLFKLVNNQYPFVWTGLYCDNGSDLDGCHWQDGSSLGSFTPFGGNFCLITDARSSIAKEWAASSRSDTNYVVCQKDPTITTALLAAMEAQSLPQHQASSKNGKLAKFTANEQ